MRSLLLSLLRGVVLLPSYLLVLLVRLCKWLIAPPLLLLQMLIGVPLTLVRVRQLVRPRFIPLTEVELPDIAWVALTNDTEAALEGRAWTRATAAAAGEVLRDVGTPIDDHRASAAYRRAVLATALVRLHAQGASTPEVTR